MVRLRGGLDIPGLNGMLAKLLLWSVSNTAFFLKAKPAFADFGVQLSKPSSYYFYSQMIESEVAPGLRLLDRTLQSLDFEPADREAGE
ncbi:hypothetical protein CLAFUW4_03813 [Fulvia fulva]|uniref:Uncharacterized protein n=1 Tax=Passalora fulva TaxID=5499 RepID=A0A9Q8L9H1_PASFU|nr:uncharacterized protein CLAFUR5_03785 [Fulvia fulva]KAK4631657.1 hypothetical protein CLAFUR4_03801 [Fulvia fulva]KAK4632623.1 hypothetical protein CLAFUR0_03800 [Fulvia fulva]UJO13385.1 hypothetical protein CLAFUR5_03785 [Fulvia fulva]WPV11128.1 hypothetical protein CLAFUW4_03813 [Fulvia fulva]WPV25990.1 hypothetical protein CLAFUW7_03805 [Fulvia fulva]